MFTVREARPDDANNVVPLLVGVLAGRQRTYQAIFAFAQSNLGRRPDDSTRPLGAVLERSDSSVAGFLGLLSSRQSSLTSGWIQHMTCWAVTPDARAQGLKLLNHVQHAHQGILTNFSATAPVQTILQHFKFSVVDEAELTFSSLSFRNIWRRISGSLATGKDAVGFATTEEQARMLADHLIMGCKVLGVQQNDRKIVAVLLPVGQGRDAAAQLIHIAPADSDAIRSMWPFLAGFVATDMRRLKIKVDSRHAPPGEEPLARKPRKMFASGLAGSPRTLTRAYGEPLNAWADFTRFNAKA